MIISPVKRSLRVRASAEAFEVLRDARSPKISHAELLKHSVRSDHEPHPRVVREVLGALRETRAAREAKEKEDTGPITGPIKKISGIFLRRPDPVASIDDVVTRFEKAFVEPD